MPLWNCNILHRSLPPLHSTPLHSTQGPPDDWWKGTFGGHEGWFPSSFTELKEEDKRTSAVGDESASTRTSGEDDTDLPARSSAHPPQAGTLCPSLPVPSTKDEVGKHLTDQTASSQHSRFVVSEHQFSGEGASGAAGGLGMLLFPAGAQIEVLPVNPIPAK